MCSTFQFARNSKTHIASANDHNTFLTRLRFAKNLKGARRIIRMGKDVNLIPCKELIARFRGKERAVTAHPHHHRAQGREQFRQLAQRGFQDGAVILKLNAKQLHLTAEEYLGLKTCGL